MPQDTFTYTASDGYGATSSTTILSIVIYDQDASYKSGFNTTLKGNHWENVLDGSAGKDVLIGGNGPDILIGGNGDTLTGGKEHDTFLFRPNFGADKITDFNVHQDVIQFDKSLFSSVNAILRHTTNTAGGAVITDTHGDTLTLAGITTGLLHLHRGDFHLA